MFKSIIDKFGEILHSLNITPIKRLLIYAILAYPPVTLYIYKDEIKLLFISQQPNVEMIDVAEAQERCYNLRKSYSAESVMVYLYQPNMRHKTYKERIVFSTSRFFQPLEHTKKVNLASQSRVLEELKKSNVSVATKTSGHQFSSMIVAYKLEEMVTTPIRDPLNSQIIGEVVWVFKDTIDVDYNTLYQEGQVFAYNIK